IEATMRAAVDAIHDQIITSAVPFGLLRESLRREVVRRFKRDAEPDRNHTMDDFPAAFVAVALHKAARLDGSVDAKAIRQLAAWYGFSCDTSSDKTYGGADLRTIKDIRNDLAHGRKSFEEVGRDYSFEQLSNIAKRSMRYMHEILSNVACYLRTQGYLETP